MNPYYFWTLWGFDAIIALVVFYFFFVGLGDGSITSQNMALWLVLIAGVAVVVAGGWWLYSVHRYLPAKTLLWVLALPGLVFVLFMLVVLIGKPRWN